MRQQNRVQLFDRWAGDYDASVAVSAGDFPFDGYERVLDRAAALAEVRPSMRVLDLGIGTGSLAARLVEKSAGVWGLDFSAAMLAQARARLPQARLVQADLLGTWPADLDQPFDRVVSAYVFHEFDLPAKLHLLGRIAARHLVPGGRVVIADVAFATAAGRALAARRWAAWWDEDEFYWAADETAAALGPAGWQTTYEQVSSCGGVFTFRPALFPSAVQGAAE